MRSEVSTASAEYTRKLGESLGGLLSGGEVIGLEGELGSGKTTFAQGLARGLGVEEVVASPSFTIIREYQGRVPLYHMDLYRLDDTAELIDVGVPDYLSGEGVAVIEWAERLRELAPGERLVVELRAGGVPDERKVCFRPHGSWWRERLADWWSSLREALEEG